MLTNQDAPSNVFTQIDENQNNHQKTNPFPGFNFQEDSSHVILETDYKNDEISIDNPLENLTSENEEYIKTGGCEEKSRSKTKRSETCPTVNQYISKMLKNEQSIDKENEVEMSFSENQRVKGKSNQGISQHTNTVLDDKSSLVNFDTSFMATYTKNEAVNSNKQGKFIHISLKKSNIF